MTAQDKQADQVALNVRRLIQDPGTTATTLHVLALKLMGSALYARETGGAEISAALSDACGGDIHETNLNKLQAIALASRSDIYFVNEEAFISITNSVCGDDPGMEYADDITMLELFLAVAEVKLNHPGEVPKFEPAIKARIKRIIERDPIADGIDLRKKNLLVVMSQIQLIRSELQQLGLPTDGLDTFAQEGLLFTSQPQQPAAPNQNSFGATALG